MSRSRHKRRSAFPPRLGGAPAFVSGTGLATYRAPGDRARRGVQVLIVLMLFAFGLWLGILYFGQRPVPNSDFPSFVSTAEPLLHGRLPANYKRLPGLGLMVLAVSVLMPEPSPALTAGWFLNAMLFPFCLVLLYLLARRWLGTWAAVLPLICAINPWTLGLLIQPIAEIPLWFFVLLSFWLMAHRSRWVYAAAGAASLIRYEGVVLIVAALALDVWERRDLRSRIHAILLAGVAALPMAAWLLLGLAQSRAAAAGGGAEGAAGAAGGYWHLFFRGQSFVPVLHTLWKTTYKVVFTTDISQSGGPVLLTAGLAAAGFIAAVVRLVKDRNKPLLGILFFFIAYWLAISLKVGTRDRYIWPLVWLFWMLSLYGWRHLGAGIWRKMNPPAWFASALSGAVAVALAIWLALLVPGLGKLPTYDSGTPLVPFVVVLAALLVAGGRTLLHGWRWVAPDVALVMLLGVMAAHNQHTLAKMLGDGQKDIEFKMLADWYRAHAQPGETMVTTLPHMVALWLPPEASLISTDRIGGEDLDGFLADCRRKNVTYIAWDSRLGLARTNSYYKRYGLDRIARLIDPQQLGPYAAQLEFVDRVVHHRLRFINIYRLRSGRDAP